MKKILQEKKNKWIILGVLLAVIIVGIGIYVNVANNKKVDSKNTSQKTQQETNTKEQEDEQIEESEDDGIPAGFTETQQTVWTTDNVKLRASNSTDSDVLSVLSRKTELTSTAYSTDWYQVTYENQTGYISAKYISTEEPEEQVQPVQASASGCVVVIDPGHQSSGDSNTEPNGPGSSSMKARVTGGTRGTTTGVSEYQLNLTIGLKLQQELQNRGYTVYMTRTTNDVNISNKERAEYATSVGADISVRIHANGADDSSISGALTLAPSASNPYVSNLASSSQSLSKCVLDAYCSATGLRNQGVVTSDTMTGINWCTVPVTILEMGYMTNASDDTNMENESFQGQMVQGIANGIDAYFGR